MTSVDVAPVTVDYETEFVNHLTNKDSIEYVLREGVALELLYSPRPKAIYQFAATYYQETGKAPTLAVLQDEYPQFNFVQPETEVTWIVGKLRERYQRNRVEAITLDLAKRAEQPQEAMRYLREKVVELDRATMSTGRIWKPGDHKIFLSQLRDKILEGGYQGSSFGYKDIDDFTGGLRKGQIGYVLARPKRQKTFNVIQAFIEQVKHQNKPYLSTLELSDIEVQQRISCLLSGVSWDRMQRGDLMPADYDLLDQAWEEFCEWGDFWIEQPPLDERTVQHFGLKADKVGAESIIISQFKYVDGTKDYYRADHEKYAETAVDLKRLAATPGKERPVLVEAQFNRGGDSMDELKDFDAAKVGLTDMIPQSADILLALCQTKELRNSQQLEYGIVESRNTDTAAWWLYYEYKTHTELRMIADSQH